MTKTLNPYQSALETMPKAFDDKDEAASDFRTRTCGWFGLNYLTVVEALKIAAEEHECLKLVNYALVNGVERPATIFIHTKDQNEAE